jgi:serine/threonine protein kinase
VAFTAPESHVPESNGFLVLPTDIWSIGVTMYTFLSQNVPFYAESELEMQINAQKKDPAHLPEFSDS